MAPWRPPSGGTTSDLTAVTERMIAGMGHGAPIAPGAHLPLARQDPWLLDVGVAASATALADWGLADDLDGSAAIAGARTARAGRRQRPAASRRGVEAVIRRALEAAGLLRVRP